MVMFGWGAKVFFELASPGQRDGHLRGRQAVDVEGAASGRARINELHVPASRPSA
jgi:hypothetical protein